MKRLISLPLFILRGLSLLGLALGVALSAMAQAPVMAMMAMAGV